MAFEVACSECTGRLMVEQVGSVVACPHCGVHLSIPEEGRVETVSVGTAITEDLNELSLEEPDSAPTFPGLPGVTGEEETIPEFQLDLESPFTTPHESPSRSLEETAFDLDTEPSFQLPESNMTSNEIPPEKPEPEETTPIPDFNNPDSEAENHSDESTGETENETDARDDDEDRCFEEESSSDNEDAELDDAEKGEDSGSKRLSDQPDEETTVETPPPLEPTSSAGSEQTVPRSRYTLVASYASAVTLAFLIYLWMTWGKADPHQLESLPDVIPKEKTKGVIERNVVSENAPMPLGHTLKLGQTQHLGNLEVTPLRVTREPVEFEHYAGDKSQTRPPSGPVLKLWLRFKNVSKDQEFMPLGADLVFHRGATKSSERMRANNFVCKIEEKRMDGKLIMVYDHVIEDVWNMKGQNIERGLGPGDEFETFIPSTEEGVDSLNGDLIWRVHLRKGLNAKTGWGITTLIEVEFESSDIQNQTATPEEKAT